MEIQIMKQKIVAVALLSAAFGVSALNAEVFYWKGGASSFGDYGNPANWDVGSSGGGNAGSLVPGASDEIFGARAAMWDLGGGTRQIGTWDSMKDVDGVSDWNRYEIQLTNGTLSVMRRYSHNDTITIFGDTTLEFPVGSDFSPSVDCGGAEVVTVAANGRLEVKGAFSPYRIQLKTVRYGYALIDPTSFRIAVNSAQENIIRVEGTNEIPHGLVWSASGTSACSLKLRVTWSGRLIAGGDFSRNGKPGTFRFEQAGGYLETCGDLSFSGVDSCTVEQGTTFIANGADTLDISNFSFYEGDTICYKLGTGTLAIGALLPPAMQVNAGTIAVKAARSDLAGMTFAGNGITVRFDVPGCRLDGIANASQLSRVTFRSGIDMDGLTAGVTLFSSSDATILAAMKAELEAAVPAGFSIDESGDSLVLADSSEITFDTSVSSDLANIAAWKGRSSVPEGEAVTIKGGGTAVFNASSPLFASIKVTAGATLSIAGGTAESPVTPPPLAMAYNGRIVCEAGSYVHLTNELACTAMVSALPVFEVATGAVVYAEGPEHATKGFAFKNMRLNWFGKVRLPDASSHSTPSVVLGTAAPDEVAMFGLNVDGGSLEVTNTASYWQGNNSIIRIMCPEYGGEVHPVGEFTWRNFVKGPDSAKVGSTTIIANSGYDIGVGNPESIAFTLNVSGTPIGLNGTSAIAGGANIVCTGADSGLVKGDTFINYTLTQQVNVRGSAKITLRDGARFSNAFVVGNKGTVYFSPTAPGHISLEIDGGTTEFYTLGNDGSRTAKVLVRNGCYDVGRLIPESTKEPEDGWDGAPYSPVFDRFAQIEVQGLLQVRATDGFPRPSWWHFDGYWDHKVLQADMPFTGTGSLLVTNMTADSSMTFTLVNRGNTMSGTISALPGTRSTLLFKDDCLWSGTVIANGCAGCVNTDATTGKEKPAYVKFKHMRLEGDFPIRLWRTEGVATNDFIEFSGVCTGAGGAFVGEPMEGMSVNAGDSFAFAKYPAASALPQVDSGRWRVSAAPIDGDANNVLLMLTYQPPGFSLSIR